MADKISAARRSANMARIKAKDSKPEWMVRRLVYRLGYRYRLHAKDLPGKPDLVFRPQKKAIFVHGCYWHGHGCAVGGTGAKSNQTYWGPKIEGNRRRDAAAILALENAGWKTLVIWECETKEAAEVSQRIVSFLTN